MHIESFNSVEVLCGKWWKQTILPYLWLTGATQCDWWSSLCCTVSPWKTDTPKTYNRAQKKCDLELLLYINLWSFKICTTPVHELTHVYNQCKLLKPVYSSFVKVAKYLQVAVWFRSKCGFIISKWHKIIIKHIHDYVLLQSQLKPTKQSENGTAEGAFI